VPNIIFPHDLCMRNSELACKERLSGSSAENFNFAWN
jgi:hypothetical protein